MRRRKRSDKEEADATSDEEEETEMKDEQPETQTNDEQPETQTNSQAFRDEVSSATDTENENDLAEFYDINGARDQPSEMTLQHIGCNSGIQSESEQSEYIIDEDDEMQEDIDIEETETFEHNEIIVQSNGKRRKLRRLFDDNEELEASQPKKKKAKRQRGRPKKRGRRKQNNNNSTQNKKNSRLRRRSNDRRRYRTARSEEYFSNQEWRHHLFPEKQQNEEWKFRMTRNGLADLDENSTDYKVNDIGDMNHICPHCTALLFKNETTRKAFCCQQGKLRKYIAPIGKPPELIYNLLTGKHSQLSEFFCEHIFKINSALSMSKIALNRKKLPQGRQKFILMGKVAQSTMQFSADQSANRAMFYTHNEQEQTKQRIGLSFFEKENRDLRMAALMNQLQMTLRRNNFLIRAFTTIWEENIKKHNLQRLCVTIESNIKPGDAEHYKNYSAPTRNLKKIATMVNVESMENQYPSHQHIYFTSRTQGVDRTVQEENPLYDPLQYVLFHPYGETGWCQSWKRDFKITARNYYRYRLFERADEWNPFIHGKELFEAWVTNQWAKVQQIELNQIKSEAIQKKMRADCYHNIYKAKQQGQSLSSIGVKANILPATFKGSPRYMSKRTQDALAMMRQFRAKPDLFITFTANSDWPEIQRAIQKHSHLKPENRDDIIARVFNAKLHALMNDLKTNNVLGQVIGYVYVVEYQKRGLPHAHILLLLHPKSKFDNDPSKYDQIICAEIPDPEKYPVLYELVQNFMIHGPCALYRHCIGNFGCTKYFPKPFRDDTTNSVDGYPLYKRRSPQNGGFTCMIEKYGKTMQADNGFVVPYNPPLLLKYRCHLNVEVCATIAAIKYLYKYIYKGHDKTYIRINTEDNAEFDECGQFEKCRFFGAAEACWRLFGFTTDKQWPPCKQLTVHLENKQFKHFETAEDEEDNEHNDDEDNEHNDDDEQKTENEDIENQATTLTEWFANNAKEKANLLDPSKRGWFEDGTPKPEGFNLLYHEYPQFYTWKEKKWERRTNKRKDAIISRMHYVNYKEGERYFLRVLLLHVRGATSYEDLRTVNGKLCATYREACTELGLLANDQIWRDTLQEASLSICSPTALRRLFANILNNNQVNDANALWEDFKDSFTDDIKWKYYTKCCPTIPKHQWVITQRMYNEALFRIQELLVTTEQTDRVLEAHGLPQPDEADRLNIQDLSKDLRKELAFDKTVEKNKVKQNVKLMNNEQKAAYQTIINAIYNAHNTNNFFFLQAKAGTGKTFVLNTIAADVRSHGDIALCNATSGIASNLFPCGSTMHSRFKIPLDVQATSSLTISRQSQRAELIKKAKIIIWDEAPMAHKNLLIWLDRQLKDIMQNDLLFGGKIVILAGDFQQIPPVIPNASKQVVIDSSIRNCALFDQAKALHLVRNERLRRKLRELQRDPATSPHQIQQEQEKVNKYEQWLNSIGNDTIQHHSDVHEYAITMPTEFVQTQSDIEKFTEQIYPNIQHHKGDSQYFLNKCIISPKNKSIDEINDFLLNQIQDEETKTYLSFDSVGLDDCSELFTEEFLNSRNFSGIPPHELKLKLNVPIILLRNIDSDAGLCNGTRMMVRRLHNHTIEATKLNDPTGERYFIPRIALTPAKKLGYEFIRKTFPVRIAFAITVNKSQGQTLNQVAIYLPDPVFQHGQLYVALSRCANPENMTIIIQQNEKQGFHKDKSKWITYNIVYKQLLL